MIVTPPYLQTGHTVAVMCLAGKTTLHTIQPGIDLLQRWGLNVIVGRTVGAAQGSLGGSDALRLAEFQEFLDNPNIKCIIAARGGYGSTRILDEVNFERFVQLPKWLVGFSDITAVLNQALALGIESIHGPMAKTMAEPKAKKAVQLLKNSLWGKAPNYTIKVNKNNRHGTAHAVVFGGNLCLLAHSVGSGTLPSFEGNILFIEDVAEQYYNIDRMLLQLRRAGLLAGLAGLVVGQFTDIPDQGNPFGQNLEQIILAQCRGYQFPIAFGFRAGHVAANMPLIIGRKAVFLVNEKGTFLTFDQK
jgi:muramoyltetrapeptide carboxypeptidase